MTDRRIQLKVKVKSLAAESKIIRREELKATGRLRCLLHLHRSGSLRNAARQAQIAYGFIRGIRYSQIERTAKTLPDIGRIRKDVVRFGACRDYGNPNDDFKQRDAEQAARLGAWLDEITIGELV